MEWIYKLAYHNCCRRIEFSNIIKGITSTCLEINLLTGVLEKEITPKPIPYSYLSEAFTLGPNRFKDYNYYLHRKWKSLLTVRNGLSCCIMIFDK